MDTPEFVRATLQTGMWTSSIDLKDAYFHVPIHPRFRKYLRFQVLGKVYQFKALPFGLNTAPRLFTKVAAQLKKMGLSLGIRLHQYIDDWLNRVWSKEEVSLKTQNLLRLIEELGWIVNLPKSDLEPTRVFEFLSYRFNLANGLVFPTEKRFQKLILELSPLLTSPLTTPCGLMSVISLMEATSRQVPLGRLHMRPVQQALAQLWHWKSFLDSSIQISPAVQEHIRVVDHPWQCHGRGPPTSTSGNFGNVHGCVAGGLGCSLHLSHGSGQLVCPGANPPYKCTGDEGYFQYPPVICGLAHQQTCSGCHRQHYCGSLCQQRGWHTVMGPVCSFVANSGLVSAEKHRSVC